MLCDFTIVDARALTVSFASWSTTTFGSNESSGAELTANGIWGTVGAVPNLPLAEIALANARLIAGGIPRLLTAELLLSRFDVKLREPGAQPSTLESPSDEDALQASRYISVGRTLASLFGYENDSGVLFDQDAILTAVRLLRVLQLARQAAPLVSWHGNDAIDFVWRRTGRTTIVTITAGLYSILPAGRFDPKLSGLPSGDSAQFLKLMADATA